MRLPRTETTLAAVLLLCAAPFALAATPQTRPTPSTPGVTPPETTPSTTNPGMTPPESTSPSARQPGTQTEPGAYPGGTTAPQTSRSQSQDLQRGGSSMSPSGGSQSVKNNMRRHSTELVPKADIAAAKSARVSLTDAINMAQQQNHGNVVSARFELRQGKPEYLIRTFDGQSRQEWLGHIDAQTGQMIGQGRTIPLSSLPKEDQQELTASQSSGGTLAQAVQTAERQRGGKALAAGLSAHNGQVGYRTELLKSNGRTQMAMISPGAGSSNRYR